MERHALSAFLRCAREMKDQGAFTFVRDMAPVRRCAKRLLPRRANREWRMASRKNLFAIRFPIRASEILNACIPRRLRHPPAGELTSSHTSKRNGTTKPAAGIGRTITRSN